MAKRKNKCATKFCRGKRTKCHTKCPKCRLRIWRAKNPLKAAYLNKKSRAKQRGIQFVLTFEEFVLAWQPGMVLDRKDARVGYVHWNVQNLTPHANAVKGATYDKRMHQEDPPF